MYLIVKFICNCLDQIGHLFLYIGVTFACFQIFWTFLCVIVALSNLSNVGVMYVLFTGFKSCVWFKRFDYI